MVNFINDSPKGITDFAQTPYETLLPRIDVLANDTDPENDPLRVDFAVSDDGEVGVNPDGTLFFNPSLGFSGVARILYRVIDRAPDDPEVLDDFGEVFVTVGEPDTPPPGRDGIILGTDAPDVIDIGYTGDPDGDRIDNADAILPGQEPQDDIILAGSGNDTIDAGLGRDSVTAGSGNDWVTTGDGSDTVTGGSGDDTIDTRGPEALPDQGYPFAPTDPLGFDPDLDPENDRDSVDAGSGDDLIFTGDDRDTILGNSGDDSIYAGFDDDEIDGGAGDDLLVGEEGRDSIFGRGGDDLIFAGNLPLLGPNPLDIPDDPASDAPFAPDRNPENGRDFVDGGDGNDRIYGADDDDTLMGGAGDDLLEGEVDDDILRGDAGNDTLRGGEGRDTMFGGDDRDVFSGAAGDIVNGGAGGDDFDTLDLRDEDGRGVRADIIYTSDDRENGIVRFLDEDDQQTGFLTFTEIENVVNCFTPGTRIATPQGARLVEELQVGERVLTRDNGMQEIRWIGSKTIGGIGMPVPPHLRPVQIKAGALGNGLPERDMMVSPQHRVLVANDRAALYFEEREVLVAAKHLTTMEGVRQLPRPKVHYIHIMFDRHEVVLSDGAWTESFQPADLSQAGQDQAQRDELLEIFPELAGGGKGSFAAARRSLKRFEAELLVN